MKSNIASCKNISVPLKHSRLYNPAHQPQPICWARERCFLHPVAFSAYTYTFIRVQIWASAAQDNALTSDSADSCRSLINIAHALKILSIKLSLMINGSCVNRRCRVCKWLALSLVGCPLPESDITWEGSPSLGYEREGVWLWKGFLEAFCSNRHVTVGISSVTGAGGWFIKELFELNLV